MKVTEPLQIYVKNQKFKLFFLHQERTLDANKLEDDITIKPHI